jgi:hypothetical protein
VARIVARYQVTSYAEWRRMVDECLPALRQRGISNVEVFHAAHGPSDVLLIFEGASVERLRATWDSGELRHWRHEGGALAEVLYVPDP